MKMKNILLTSALVVTMALAGCSSEGKKDTDDNENKVVETQPNELTAEETKTLKPGDIVPEGKNVNRELLEINGLDYVYVYDRHTIADDGETIKNSARVVQSYKERPSELKADAPAEYKERMVYFTFVYTLKNMVIVSVDFVELKDGEYKKQITYEDGRIELVDVIDIKNIEKDKVKNLK